MDKPELMRAEATGAASGNSTLSIRSSTLTSSGLFRPASALSRRRRSTLKRLRFADQGLRPFRVC